jgi:hypothetical protein
MATQQQYGYTGYYKPPKVPTSTIAQAAAGKRTTTTDPFGLLTDTTDSARVARINATPHVPGSTVVPAGTAPGATPFHEGPMIPGPAGPNTAPTPAAAYDIHTDPALQEVDALTGKNDQEAAAAALAQKQGIALDLGDAGLARKLGLGDLVAEAAAANPNSAFAQLGTQHDRKTHDLTEELNKANLLFGGYRVTQEDQAAKDFQDAIAQAASGANQSIGQVDSNLAASHGLQPGAADPGAPRRLRLPQDRPWRRHRRRDRRSGTDDGHGASGADRPGRSCRRWRPPRRVLAAARARRGRQEADRRVTSGSCDSPPSRSRSWQPSRPQAAAAGRPRPTDVLGRVRQRRRDQDLPARIQRRRRTERLRPDVRRTAKSPRRDRAKADSRTDRPKASSTPRRKPGRQHGHRRPDLHDRPRRPAKRKSTTGRQRAPARDMHLRQTPAVLADRTQREGGAQAFADIVAAAAAHDAHVPYTGVPGAFDGSYAPLVQAVMSQYGRDWVLGGQMGKPPVAWP